VWGLGIACHLRFATASRRLKARPECWIFDTRGTRPVAGHSPRTRPGCCRAGIKRYHPYHEAARSAAGGDHHDQVGQRRARLALAPSDSHRPGRGNARETAPRSSTFRREVFERRTGDLRPWPLRHGGWWRSATCDLCRSGIVGAALGATEQSQTKTEHSITWAPTRAATSTTELGTQLRSRSVPLG
jgi:hypothetical protein